MRILIVGSGGREHALAWDAARSGAAKVYVAPGNAGMEDVAECVPIESGELAKLAWFAELSGIDLTIVGPEDSLVDGIVDLFNSRELPIFGPSAKAAKIEGSKVWCKNFLHRHNIPTADFAVYSDSDLAEKIAYKYIEQEYRPLVIKPDGLTGGKGVRIIMTVHNIKPAIDDLMVKKIYGSAGDQVVFEEFLNGQELSAMALAHNGQYLMLLPARDHKEAYPGGPMTGGMVSYAPVPDVGPQLMREIKRIIQTTIRGLAEEGINYSGVLYAGLMLTSEGPKVLEFNCRFGDPETQALLPLYSGLLGSIQALREGRIVEPVYNGLSSFCLVIASEGYPKKEDLKLGYLIEGIEQARQAGALVFSAGAKGTGDGRLVNDGGRVKNVVCLGDTLAQARERAYEIAPLIQFKGAWYRQDIGL